MFAGLLGLVLGIVLAMSVTANSTLQGGQSRRKPTDQSETVRLRTERLNVYGAPCNNESIRLPWGVETASHSTSRSDAQSTRPIARLVAC